MSGSTENAISASHQFMEHDDQDPDQDEDIFKDGDDAGGEHLIQRVDVGGDARDQAADRVLVEEADVHALQMAEDLAAQVEHDLLAGPLHQVGLGEFQSEAEQQQSKIDATPIWAMPISGRELRKRSRNRGGRWRKGIYQWRFWSGRAENVGAGLQDDGR